MKQNDKIVKTIGQSIDRIVTEKFGDLIKVVGDQKISTKYGK